MSNQDKEEIDGMPEGSDQVRLAVAINELGRAKEDIRALNSTMQVVLATVNRIELNQTRHSTAQETEDREEKSHSTTIMSAGALFLSALTALGTLYSSFRHGS